jgi:precorrin-8X/cobalt-precorrin-8 methylmutase
LTRSAFARQDHPVTRAHPIEVESYRILRSRLDTAGLPPLTRAVVERIVHTTADPTWVGDVVTTESALSAGRAALLAGAPLVTDVSMVAAGITTRECLVGLRLAGAGGPTELPTELPTGLTRSAAGVWLAARRHPDGAVWAIGNAPTALAELVRLARAGQLRPALVIGVPVGFVGAVAAKAELRASGLPAVSTMTERGGAAIAAAAVNALLYHAEEDLR